MNDNYDEIVQYFIINSELNLSPGKACAQVAHVATLITQDIYYTDKYNSAHYYAKLATWNEWISKYNQKKIILRGKEKDLHKLIKQGFAFIRDIGCNNECEPGSLTCVGLPPMKRSEAQKYIKRLQLY